MPANTRHSKRTIRHRRRRASPLNSLAFNGSTRYCYDRRGNLVRKVQTVVGGTTLTVGATYDGAGHLVGMTYPSGAIVTYVRNDGTGRITGVAAVPVAPSPQVTLVSATSYLPMGPLNSFTFGNGRIETKSYDQNYGIDLVNDSAATNPLSEDFTLNAVGNVTGLSERVNGTTTPVARTFTYDGLDRLTAQKNGTASVESFTYNATGDRLSKTGTTYTYPASSHRLSSVGSTARTYDANGNTIAIGTAGATYDDRNRLRDVKANSSIQASYRYNGKGERVLKTNPVTGTSSGQFVYDEAGHLLGEYNTTTGARIKEYVWLDDTLVAVLSSFDGTTYQYVETDHLGTPRAVIQPTKNIIIWRWDLNNTAFGDHVPNFNPDGDSLNYSLNLRYPGQYADAESGLRYNYFRDYEPGTGRYIESDPIGLRGGASTYGYVGGNALSYFDSQGLAPNQVCVAAYTATCAAVGGGLGFWGGGVLGGLAGTGVAPIAGTAAGAIGGAELGGLGGASAGGIAGNALGNKVCPDGGDPCSGLRKQLELHKQKLRDYMANPKAHDNKGLLGQGNDAVEIARRIKSLQGQIAHFEREIAKCEANNAR